MQIKNILNVEDYLSLRLRYLFFNSNLSTSGTFSIINGNHQATDANALPEPSICVYNRDIGASNVPDNAYGVILTVGCLSDQAFQLASSFDNPSILFYRIKSKNVWGTWIQLNPPTTTS